MNPRPLRGFERVVALINNNYPFNAVLALDLEHPPTTGTLQQVLLQLQRRHPALRSRIEGAGRERFVYDAERPIPFETMESGDPGARLKALESGLNTRIDHETGPLLNCRLIRDSARDRATLLLSFHHAVMDAASSLLFLQEWLRAACASEPVGPETTPMPAIEARFPPAFRGWRRTFSLAAFMRRQLAEELTFLLDGAARRDQRPGAGGACRVIRLELDEQATNAAIRAARTAGVTMNSYLNAAMTLAFHRTRLDGRPQQVRMVSFADLRPYLSPPLENEILGAGISMVRISERLKEGVNFRDFARQVHARLQAAFRHGDKFSTYLLSDRMVQLILRMKRVRLGTTALSYNGALELPERFGGCRLTRFQACISNNRFGALFTAQAALFRNRLGIDAVYMDGEMTRAQAQATLDEMERLLGS